MLKECDHGLVAGVPTKDHIAFGSHGLRPLRNKRCELWKAAKREPQGSVQFTA